MATFYLAPHPLSENIVLIKHAVLPSIDACHAELAALSVHALDTVAVPAPRLPAKKAAKLPRKEKANKAVDACSPSEAVKSAQQLLEEYEYAEAATMLAGIRITAGHEVDILEKGVRMLVQVNGGIRASGKRTRWQGGTDRHLVFAEGGDSIDR